MFWNFTPIHCHNCGEPIWVPLRREEVVGECQNCGETNLVPPAPERAFGRRRRTIAAIFSGLGAVLLVAAGIGAFTVWSQLSAGWSTVRLAERHASAEHEFLAENYQQARDQLVELSKVDVLSDRELYWLAECQLKLEDVPAAQLTMEQLAGWRAPPYSTQAHLWLGRHFLEGANDPLTLSRAEQHLAQVVTDDPAILEAHRLLLAIKLPSGRLRDAVPNFKALSDTSGEHRLQLAAAYEQTGNNLQARDEARKVLHAALTQAAEKPTDALRLLAARAAQLLGDYPQAEDLLRGGMRRDGCDAPKWLGPLSELEWMWANSSSLLRPGEVPGAEPPPGESLADVDRIEQSLRLEPNAPRAYVRLKKLASRHDAVGAEARLALQKELARGLQPVLVHCLLAELASEEKRPAEAMLHWRHALVLSPYLTVAMNNLAAELTWLDPPDLNEAMTLIERAIELEPQQATYHETRGQILARLGRNEEALAELAPALKALPDNARLHATLAEIYREKGLTGPANKHAALAVQFSGGSAFTPLRMQPDGPKPQGE